MFAFLVSCFRSDFSGSVGPFTITGVNLTQNQAGVSCGDPYKWNVALAYSGTTVGKTCKVERSFDGGDFEVVATGVSPTSFPYVMSVLGYYNKFGTPASTIARVTDEASPTNTATSDSIAVTYNLCL